jgi:NADH-quinone oxidoreductase subunit D
MTTTEETFRTNEGGQEMRPRHELTAVELMRNVGSVLRLSETEAAAMDINAADPSEDQTMIINMGAALQAHHWLPAYRHGKAG